MCEKLWSGVAISSCYNGDGLYLPQSEGGMTSSQLCLGRSHCVWWPGSSLWTHLRVYKPQTGPSGGRQEIRRLSPEVRGISWRLLTWLCSHHHCVTGHWYCELSARPMVDCSWWCWLGHWASQAQLVVTLGELGTLGPAGQSQHSTTVTPANHRPLSTVYSLSIHWTMNVPSIQYDVSEGSIWNRCMNEVEFH